MVIHCYLVYLILGVPMFNHMAYSAIVWHNVPGIKLSHCLLIVIDCGYVVWNPCMGIEGQPLS